MGERTNLRRFSLWAGIWVSEAETQNTQQEKTSRQESIHGGLELGLGKSFDRGKKVWCDLSAGITIDLHPNKEGEKREAGDT